MPDYNYLCDDGHRVDVYFPIGTAQRVGTCTCGKTSRLVIGAGVNIAPSALETKGADVRAIDKKEDGWHKDMPAYKRMRGRGMQPKQIDGSAALEERAGDQLDVRWQDLYRQGATRERIIEGTQQVAEMVAAAKADSE